jgi:threonine synthase
MVAVQASGCAPIVKAYEDGVEHAELWQGAHTVAAGIRVPVAIGDFLILRAVRESNGFAVAVEDDLIEAGREDVAKTEGLHLCPEGAATYAAYKQELASGRIGKGERVVLFNCGNGLKYPMPPAEAALDLNRPIDYAAL